MGRGRGKGWRWGGGPGQRGWGKAAMWNWLDPGFRGETPPRPQPRTTDDRGQTKRCFLVLICIIGCRLGAVFDKKNENKEEQKSKHRRTSESTVSSAKEKTLKLLSVWGQLINFPPIFIFYAYFGMVLKGMGESFILSEDEPLTPNIDGVMAL